MSTTTTPVSLAKVLTGQQQRELARAAKYRNNRYVLAVIRSTGLVSLVKAGRVSLVKLDTYETLRQQAAAASYRRRRTAGQNAISKRLVWMGKDVTRTPAWRRFLADNLPREARVYRFAGAGNARRAGYVI